MIASLDQSGSIRLWEAQTALVSGTVEATGMILPAIRLAAPGSAIAIDNDGRWLATGDVAGTLELWGTSRLLSGPPGEPVEPLARITQAHDGSIFGIAFSPSGDLLVSAGGSRLLLWELADIETTGMRRIRVLFLPTWGPGGASGALAFSSDGNLLAAGGQWGGVGIWDISALHEAGGANVPLAFLEGHDAAVQGLDFNPDGRYLVSSDTDGNLRLWDVEATFSGSENWEIGAWLKPENQGPIFDLAFSPASDLFATASQDGNARLWSLAADEGNDITLTLADMLPDYRGQVYTLAFSPDGHWLATAGESGTLKLWSVDGEALLELACYRLERNLTQTEWEKAFSEELYRPTCPDLPYHFTAAEELAKQGRVQEALERLGELDTADLGTNKSAEQIVIDAVLARARELIVETKSDEAMDYLEQIATLDTGLPIPEPHSAVIRIMIEVADETTDELVTAANLDRASKLAAEVDDLELDLEICLSGTIKDLAAFVAGSCRRVTEAAEITAGTPLASELAFVSFQICDRGTEGSEATEAACRRAVDLTITGETVVNEIPLNATRVDSVESGLGQVWSFTITGTLTIDVLMDAAPRSELDSYLVLLDPDGRILAQDDDGGGDQDALIDDITLVAPGTYRVIARGYAGSVGSYQLILRENTP